MTHNTPHSSKIFTHFYAVLGTALSYAARIPARLFGLRPRMLVTANRVPRLRYAAPGAVAFVTLLSLGAVQNALHVKLDNLDQTSLASAQEPLPLVVLDPSEAEKERAEGARVAAKVKAAAQVKEFLTDPTDSAMKAVETLAHAADEKSEEELAIRRVTIRSGDTVSGRLQELGVPYAEVHQALEAMEEHFDPRKIRVGQELVIETQPMRDEENRKLRSLGKMTLPFSPAAELVVARHGDEFRAEKIERKLYTVRRAAKTTLKYSLYGSAAEAGIPQEVIARLIRVYSWNVDFQRDIRSGDEIEILYEVKQTEDGFVMDYGDIEYARLVTGGRDLPLYRFETPDGHVDFFDPNGQSARKTLMRTPVDGARVSSGFGMRRHPILGYNKMHKGVDFAAPTGTPIYAAGDGVVERSGRWGAYGKYVRLRHNSTLKTAYAHLHRINVRAGERVKQGQVIGTVGSTGRSTGPHLHYEVIVNGKQVNPRGVDLPTGEQLEGKTLQAFQSHIRELNREYADLSSRERFAQAGTSELR